ELIVFRPVGAELAAVLEVSTASHGSSAGKSSSTRAVLAVTKRQTAGFYDWVVTTTAQDGHKAPTKTVETYVWRGSGYGPSLRTLLLGVKDLKSTRAILGERVKLVGSVRDGKPI